MAVLATNGRNNLWFGTLDKAEWLPTPNRGADVSATGWNDGGSTLNGGGFQLNSFGSAKNYVFEWPTSSSLKVASRLQAYKDGTYGRGLIYFVDPLTYNVNVFPSQWADPSKTIGQEGASLIPGVGGKSLPTPDPDTWDHPVRSAFYDLGSIGVSLPEYLDESNSVFLPIPDGYDLHIGASYEFTGTSGIYIAQVPRGGVPSSTYSKVEPLAQGELFNTIISKQPGSMGVRVWMGKTTEGPATVTVTALMARLAPSGKPVRGEKVWLPGQGNSGTRFVGNPTLMNQSGTDGGQVSFAASFREVGSWLRG